MMRRRRRSTEDIVRYCLCDRITIEGKDEIVPSLARPKCSLDSTTFAHTSSFTHIFCKVQEISASKHEKLGLVLLESNMVSRSVDPTRMSSHCLELDIDKGRIWDLSSTCTLNRLDFYARSILVPERRCHEIEVLVDILLLGGRMNTDLMMLTYELESLLGIASHSISVCGCVISSSHHFILFYSIVGVLEI